MGRLDLPNPIMTPPCLSRREILTGLAVGALASSARAEDTPPVKAIAFDGFPIFDPRSISARAREMFPEKGEALSALWSAKLFAYTWLTTDACQYSDFATLADESLSFAAESMKLDISIDARRALVDAYSQLNVWPDVMPVLERLRSKGIRLVFLSNLTEQMLLSNMKNAGITSLFEPPLSTDLVKQFKPAPAAYHMAMDALKLTKAEIGFAAFGGWDAVGATWFGYRTVWINRLNAPRERLGPAPALVRSGMEGVAELAMI